MAEQGTPPPVFMPARPYAFEFGSEVEEITVPLRGEYPKSSGRVGSYDISPEPGSILFGTLTEVLFYFRSYPKLEDNERFVILGLDIAEGGITVVGQLLRFLEE